MGKAEMARWHQLEAWEKENSNKISLNIYICHEKVEKYYTNEGAN